MDVDTYGGLDLDRSRNARSISAAEATMAILEKAELELQQALTKKRQANEKLIQAALLENIDERREAEEAALKALTEAEEELGKLKLAQEDIIQATRLNNLDALNKKHKGYLKSIALEEVDRENAIKNAELDRLTNIFKTRSNMETERQTLERDNLIRHESESLEAFKVRLKTSTTLQLNSSKRLETLEAVRNKNAIAQADFLINHQEIARIGAATRHEQRIEQIHTAEVELAISREGRAQEIQDSIQLQKIKHLQELNNLEIEIEKESLNRKVAALQTLQKLEAQSRKRSEEGKTKQQTFTEYSEDEINAAGKKRKRKMLQHNRALNQYKESAATAMMDEKKGADAEKAVNSDIKLKYLTDNAVELSTLNLQSMAQEARERAAQAAITTLSAVSFSEDQINAEANPQKKQEMQNHNAALKEYKVREATARLDERKAQLDKKRLDATIELANLEENVRLDVADKILANENEITKLRREQATILNKDGTINVDTFSSDMKVAREKKSIANNPDTRWLEDYKKMLIANPGDDNYTKTSEQYQADVAALENQRGDARFLDSDGNFSQELFDAEMKKIDEEYLKKDKKYGEFIKMMEKTEKEKEKDAKRKKTKNKREENISNFKTAFGASGASIGERVDALKAMGKGADGKFDAKVFAASMGNALADVAKQLESTVDEVGKHMGPVDTRLYGSDHTFASISSTFKSVAAASPVVLQSDLVNSLETLVEKGISHNIQLKAFLDTTSKKIASTFEVADSAMLRLIRLQKQDSTAARMGMESALTAFLNNMHKTTEYLSDVADSVRTNLLEAQALMGAKEAAEFEYISQKWMGSMYSVGMSDSAVSSIATTLGQLAAGQIEALTSGGTGNLMVMAANKAGISIGEVLAKGLNSDQTNELLQASVEYLKEIAARSDSKVVQQQLAGIFGVTAADLKAMGNLEANDLQNINKNKLTTEGMIAELAARAGSMAARTSMGEMLTNMWENVKWTIASGIANNPITYALLKFGTLLEKTTGGIPIPFLNVHGFGVDIETKVSDLMLVGALAGGIFSGIGSLVSGLGNAGADLLTAVGIGDANKIIQRGNGMLAKASAGADLSLSGLVSNAAGGDVQSQTMAQAADTIKSLGDQAREEEEDATRDDIIEVLKMLFKTIEEKIDINTQAIQLGSLKMIDLKNGTNEAEKLQIDGWTNGSIYSVNSTARAR